MLFRMIDKMSKQTFNKVKWFLTAVSGMLTSMLIIALETRL
jgi:hypothetical protein